MRSSACWSSMALSLPPLRQLKPDSGLPQAREEGVAHRHRGSQLPRPLRQLAEGEAETRFGKHLRGLAVAGVAAADLGADALAAALADEGPLEPAALALGLARPLPRRFQLQQQVAGRRQL